MQTVRLYSGDDGESHFEDIEFKFEPDRQMESTSLGAAKSVNVRRVPPGAAWTGAGVVLDWHPAPRRQYLFTLSGAWDIECGGGEVRRFQAGDIMLADDLTGRGHTSRVIGDVPHVFAVVPLAD